MRIFYALAIWIGIQIIAGIIFGVFWYSKEEREREHIANLPTGELLQYVLRDDDLCDTYWIFRTHMSDESATNFVVTAWLIKNNLIGYVKD